MPMFMFVSGFFCYRPNKPLNWQQTIKQRFTRLIPPFIIWSFVITPALWNWNTAKLLEKVLYPDRGLWFLWVLFVLNVIFVLLSAFAEKKRFNQSLILIGGAFALFGIYLVTNFRYFGFQFIAWHFMFFTCGFLFHRYQTQIDKYWKYLFAVSAVFFPVLAWNWQMKEMPVLFGFSLQSSLWLYSYKFITAIFGIPFFWYLFRITNIKLNWLNRLGQNTIGIYAIHFLLLNYIVEPAYNTIQYNTIQYNNPLYPYLFLIVMTVLVVAICNLLIYGIRKVAVLKWMLLGEK
jgi:fucose 4-O-acetylase-like acetyltransferase